MQPFTPLFRSAHLATLAGNFWQRRLDTARFPVAERCFDTEPGVQILVHSQCPDTDPAAHLILVHGLEGSSAAGYARSLAQASLESGFAVHRLNMRSCGGTESVCGTTLYHSGQTGDVLAVARQLAQEGARRIYMIGFSLGGNVVLKAAGELGSNGHDVLSGIVAVSAPIDLAACVRQIEKPSNLLYARRFVSRLKERIRIKESITPGCFDLSKLDRVKTVYEFDDTFTAPSFGFGTADNYYATQSSNQFLPAIRVPALIVHAQDDPMIPFEVYRIPAFAENPWLRLVTPTHGGHLGFVGRGEPRFWLDALIVEWLQSPALQQPRSLPQVVEQTAAGKFGK